MIKIENVSKYYGNKENRFQVLKDINLEILDGEFLVILGPSGSGKSTLLNVVSCLEKVDEGCITYNNTKVTNLKDQELTIFRRQNIGFIFQQYYLLSNLTVEKNVKMGASLAKNNDYIKIIEEIGLKDKIKKYPYELSGGEQQRVAIARALAKNPKVLFLDEPTGALDEKTGRQVLDYITKLHKQIGFTIIMVTHNENIACMADRVVYMNSGKIVDIKLNNSPLGAYEIGW